MKEALEKNHIKYAINLRDIGRNTGEETPKKSKKYYGTDGEEVSEFIIECRKLARDYLNKRNKNRKSFLNFPKMAQFRTTRRIKGIYTLSTEDINKSFKDSIGCAVDWRQIGDVYEIPFRTLISRDIDNIITAGRTISSEGDSWEVTRVIPAAALTGQAAGEAASLCCNNNISLQEINLCDLQNKLSNKGVIVHQ